MEIKSQWTLLFLKEVNLLPALSLAISLFSIAATEAKNHPLKKDYIACMCAQ